MNAISGRLFTEFFRENTDNCYSVTDEVIYDGFDYTTSLIKGYHL